MKVQRAGLLLVPPGEGLASSHAQNPFPQYLSDGGIRIHFACRDDANRARGFAADFSPEELLTAQSVEEARLKPRQLVGPTIDLGELGAFDDSGVMPSCIVTEAETQYLYYTGWSKAVTVPFSFHIGLAVSHDGGQRFERVSRAPVLGRNQHDPFIAGAPWVLREGDRWRMWYSSCTRWEHREGEHAPRHYYTIKHADSDDGIHWRTSDALCLPYRDDEYALARPVVTPTADGYRMLFSHRFGDQTYRVGAARSPDGLIWEREDRPVISAAAEDAAWDQEMACYACPVEAAGQMLLLYNGNGYGRTGFGVASEE